MPPEAENSAASGYAGNPEPPHRSAEADCSETQQGSGAQDKSQGCGRTLTGLGKYLIFPPGSSFAEQPEQPPVVATEI